MNKKILQNFRTVTGAPYHNNETEENQQGEGHFYRRIISTNLESNFPVGLILSICTPYFQFLIPSNLITHIAALYLVQWKNET